MEKFLKDDLHILFKDIRSALGITQSVFAKGLNTKQSTVADIERGKILPNKDIIQALIRKYSINLNWFFTGKGDMFLEQIDSEPSTPQNTDIAQQLNALKTEFKQGITSIKKELEQKINARPAPTSESIIEEPNAQDYDSIDIPYAEGLAAGQPHEIFYDYASHKVNKELIKGDKNQYRVIKIKGTSMVNAGIPDKSNVLIKNDKQLTSGRIMVFRSGGELTIKRYIKAGGKQYIQWDDGSGKEEELTPEWAVVASYIGVLK